MIKKLLFIIVSFTLLSFTLFPKKSITIYMIGDSTMANKPLIDNPERGWGQLFSQFFNEKTRIENHAMNGRSTKSFIDEGRWDSVYTKLQKGDYLFIQFGHNDEKADKPNVYAEAHTTYKDNLIKFITESKSKGAIPILVTPVMRRRFDEKGAVVDTHGDYPAVVKEVAALTTVSVIDLHEKSTKLLSDLGVEGSKALFLHIAPGVYKSLPEGKKDDTHFSEFGATKIGALVVEGIKEQNLELKKYLKNE